MGHRNYVTRVLSSAAQLDACAWDSLLAAQPHPTPFMQHAFLVALERSGSATPATGWTPCFVTLHEAAGQLVAACPLYIKTHSRGEYVFDWSWAEAYHRHSLNYYPKAVLSVPFTPVPGTRLLAVDEQARMALVQAILAQCQQAGLSSLHVLFAHTADMQACTQAQLLTRHTVQFHWHNRPQPYRDFDDFLALLNQDKRKKIRQERRRVREAGVLLRHAQGTEISRQDWDFFYSCYERTYLEHGNTPYLTRRFFEEIARTQAHHWLMFIAERDGHPIASSLIAVSDEGREKIAWGRYWGALERVDCLHFEACYYSPLQWCIAHGYHRFEGGAQGEHKLARALMPVRTDSAHWLAHPDFAQAVTDLLQREGRGIDNYLDELEQHTPFKPLS